MPPTAKKRGILQNQPILLLLAGLTLIAMAVVVIFLLSGNNDDDADVSPDVSNPNVTPSTGGTSGGPEPVSEGPASLYGVLLDELPPSTIVNEPETFAMNITTFASSYWFDTEQEGAELAAEWGILDGFQAQYDPVGETAQVLQGSYYVWTETYLFASTDGADAAFNYLENRLATRNGSERVTARLLANESAGFEFIQGTVGSSEVVGIFHRFVFRRGNVIGVVQTYGAETYMTIDRARDVAVMMDEKLLGARPAPEPTRIPTPSFPTFDPTPAGGE